MVGHSCLVSQCVGHLSKTVLNLKTITMKFNNKNQKIFFFKCALYHIKYSGLEILEHDKRESHNSQTVSLISILTSVLESLQLFKTTLSLSFGDSMHFEEHGQKGKKILIFS